LLTNLSDNYSIIIYSSDGINTTYNYSVIQGNINIYNSTNPENDTPISHGGVTMILAYKKDGEYLDEELDGNLKIAFINEDEGLITSSKLWAKFVTSIEIIA
jgi:hypothetical protein